MGSLYVVSGKSFYRAFTISSEENSESSKYHDISKVNEFLDKVWLFAGSLTEQSSITTADGRIGDRACIVVIFNDNSMHKKIYRRNFGVDSDYTGQSKRNHKMANSAFRISEGKNTNHRLVSVVGHHL